MQVFHSLTDPVLRELLLSGAVGILPTDTVYGLVCCAADEKAVARLYGLKNRHHKPGTLIAATTDQFVKLGIKARYLKAVERYWPGAVSVEIPHGTSYLSQNTGRQAVRIPDDKALLELMLAVGPLQTTSANLPSKSTAENFDEAYAYFSDKIDFYVDMGDVGSRPPSTIIRIVDDAIEVLRLGAVTVDESGRIIHEKN